MVNKESKYIELKWLILSFSVGLLFTYYLMPQLILHPSNISILKDDALQHYIGWEFFRNSQWQWPLTFNSRLMYPFGISLIFTDSFPLVSIVLKLFRNQLPEPFIWQGYVVVINISLMFYFSIKLLKTRISSDYYCIVGGIIFITSQPLLFRSIEHISLTTQWLIIFQLYLILKPKIEFKKDLFYQSLILFIVAGTHPYLAGMLLPMSVSLCYNFWHRKQCSGTVSLLLFMSLCLELLLFAWFFGWFDIHSSGSSFGYGFYSFNLLSFINPQYGSFILKDIPVGQWQYEGSAYLGVGVIILLGITLYNLKLKYFSMEQFILFIILIVLCIFAVSNVVQIGSYQINFDLSDTLTEKFGIFRSSGRFAWPLYYFIVFVSIVGAYRVLANTPYRRAVFFLIILIMQVADNYLLIKKVKDNWQFDVNRESIFSDLRNPIWYKMSQYGVKHIFISKDFNGGERSKFALLSLRNNLTINMMYLSRDSDIYNNQYESGLNNLANGILESNTIYILNKDFMSNSCSNNCTIIDNYTVCSSNKKLLAKFGNLMNN